MQLTDAECAMRDGAQGDAVAAAMDLLIRYGEALDADRLIETDNVAGAFNASTPSVRPIAERGMAEVFSKLNLDSDKTLDIPHMAARTCQLITGIDDQNWALQGADPQMIEMQRKNEAFIGKRGINLFATCTPYQVGNVPTFGEHCAWMESSAVIYCNGALGGRTNVEGKESTGAAALTGRIPYWGYHLTENRFGNRHVRVDVPVNTMMDWGLLGYFTGEQVEEAIPVIEGQIGHTDLIKLKHFGAAAASSGGVEMYHIPGRTPEARTPDEAFGPRRAEASFVYDAAARKAVYEMLQTATDPKVDFIMLGCPHNSIEQVGRIAHMLDGKRLHPDVQMWVHTPRAIRDVAVRSGYVTLIEAAGGQVMSDTCPAISRRIPEGVRVIATDSAKQAHYLPAIAKVQGWFGSLEACIEAGLTGTWKGDF
ncbi:MAG: aconitase X catalytic domain-containing protein [Alphaproteobacteria bacterium]|nr:aconitase X catalytic domain-containing protein [Alphaproteobacteria bacterium]MBU1573668.1 aconitase X catalytic domain-containing protein [Alphaproteobacteria bacterium]MBU2079430.1 aconitase X catalytic domain-containing protein [Alphaproteobacteria bacterium]MBU2161809.1 aconitase X catalytic domain-containing protein [Alphaproteobacteria bacterium]MBU2243939.1 aconitase X catalytic domain-containing protein [Alphaproteobacteria bacterium]